ncbi:carboxylating nicotinate-nucleotide diphosphorylase [Fodinibius salsisoli]|uniref:nicotinate-nucleotide diphosphorylase (carboxylating) n=1 Tax=Fodinibius salsisoli TaxID=2820877 RepID=A0ABT3PRT0_9BACT|nr:carboxylating nicotinate-nucleotide diphosphorylase [Fodinibius salsisoli]MCW9708577.1 carboxylating nicotinate-nucleotide diphosphorylase [Fodinibius salsisoli]
MATKITQASPNLEAMIDELINRGFEEDIRTGDATTNAIIDEQSSATAVWNTKDEGIIAGLSIAEKVFKKLDSELQWEPHVKDGETVKKGAEIVSMKGKACAILTAERLALNITQRMSGIATKTRQFVDVLEGLDTQILDTRKTAPGLRLLDKYAVKAGGGQNHRMGLYDLAMIKDNHIIAAGGIAPAVQKVRNHYPELDVEVEASTLQQVQEALASDADIIMLDNMSPAEMRKAVKTIAGRAKTEASGNVTLPNVRDIAETGVDCISVGALTHSVQAFDISQTLQELT